MKRSRSKDRKKYEPCPPSKSYLKALSRIHDMAYPKGAFLCIPPTFIIEVPTK
jgi:hypothetical protein